MSRLIFRIIVSYLYFSHYFGLKVLQWLLNIFKRRKTHESYDQLCTKKKDNQVSNMNLGGKKKASARNVLLGCIFLYIHNCFYTARICHSWLYFLLTLSFFLLFFASIFNTQESAVALVQHFVKNKNKKKRLLAIMIFFLSTLWRGGFFLINLIF